eukprot:scaffold1321_cov402-Prasinococcus_capsulatus_cf.AAC.10
MWVALAIPPNEPRNRTRRLGGKPPYSRLGMSCPRGMKHRQLKLAAGACVAALHGPTEYRVRLVLPVRKRQPQQDPTTGRHRAAACSLAHPSSLDAPSCPLEVLLVLAALSPHAGASDPPRPCPSLASRFQS